MFKMSPIIERRLFTSYLLSVMFWTDMYLFTALLVPPLSQPLYLALAIAVAVCIVFFIFFAIMTRLRRPMEIKQEGIRFQNNQALQKGFVLMFWHEARFFACYPEPGPWNDDSVLIYELSSASLVVRWVVVQRRGRFAPLMELFFPFSGEANRQAQALCSLVAARTGLPLYDLSKKKATTRDILSWQ
jgi:hypothetical protein